MRIRRLLLRPYWLITQWGIDPRKMLRAFLGLPHYLCDLARFRTQYHGRLGIQPCLHDWYEEGGATQREYFWQDLLVARMIFEAKPERHVDVGSRVDGFVSHVASFREIEVFDIRPITTHVPGIRFKQADLMSPVAERENYCDSLSCLHALEHFGLGRYGDPIDPSGYERGIANMGALLRPGGTFYLSTPIGQARVEFNAHRVFDPHNLVELVERRGLSLRSVTVISSSGDMRESSRNELKRLAESTYNLVIFIFTKH